MTSRVSKLLGWGMAGALLVGSLTVVANAPASAATTVPRDGLQSYTAAPSCWSIKQNYPSSTDGIYWLWTPTLIQPQQFYCDMTTDGGGWVLIGRGRQGWSFAYKGQGSASTLRNTITGTAAFSPAALPTATVNGLLNGAALSGLTDGIRVRRAMDTAGSNWQDLRMYPATNFNQTWTWALGGGVPLSRICFSGNCTTITTSYYQTNTTANMQRDNSYQRVITYPSSNHAWKAGFTYGSNVSGVNNSTSYLWQNGSERYAIPFSQVFVRPHISEADVSGGALAPSAGLPESTVRAMLDPNKATLPWGVTGLDKGTADTTNSAYVLAFAQVGNTVYVGGKFLSVQNGPGGTPVSRPYIAAFNATTGEWIPSFNPTLNGPVWEMIAKDGRLFVGGEFTNVNGEANTDALAELDPVTGAVKPGFRATFTSPTGGQSRTFVRALDIQDNWLYVGGNFNTVAGGSTMSTVGAVKMAARVRLSDGKPDAAWHPVLPTAPMDIDASPQGDRVYMVGSFRTLNGVTLVVPRLAIVDTVSGALVPGLQPFHNNADTEFQQAILENGDKVYQGGSQHMLHMYNRSDYSFVRSHIARVGGDFQAITLTGGIVYASCHCNNWQYQDTNVFATPQGYSRVDQIVYIGAYDANTFDVIPEFSPSLVATGAGSEGPWELFVDNSGALWAGGDLDLQTTSGAAFYGGFVKFNPRDTTAPSVPANFSATTDSATSLTTLTWSKSTDNAAGSIQYEVLRDDPNFGTQVVASTYDRTITLPTTTTTRYFVRAVDVEGNRSATTAFKSAGPADNTPPGAPTNLQVGPTTMTSVSLSWTAPGDADVTGYQILRGGNLVGTSTGTTFQDTGLKPGTTYSYSVKAVDGGGNVSPASGSVPATTDSDTVAPSKPAGLQTTSVSAAGVGLSWTASTDNVAVDHYEVTRSPGGLVAANVAGTSYTDSSVTAGTSYSYTVKAVDAAGNSSAASDALPVTVPATGFSENWTASNGSAWSSDWATSQSNGALNVQGNTGQMSYTDAANAYARAQLTGFAASANTDVVFSYTWSSTAARAYFNVYVKGSGGWANSYRPRNGYGVQTQSDAKTVTLTKVVNGTVTTLASVSGLQGSGKQWVRLRVAGSTVQMKVWSDGQPEPSTWAAQATDADVTAAGQLFFSLNRASANVGAKAINLDDLTVS